MRKTLFVSLLSIAVLLSLTACTDDKQAAALRAARALPAKPVPTTPLEIAKDAYEKNDFPKALDYFERAARAGDANAEFYVGAMLSVGDGARRNPEAALKHFEAAAAKEQPDALYALGRRYLVGDGVDRDPNKALALFDRAVLAYPPGDGKDRATETRDALAKVMEEQANPEAAAKAAAAEAAAKVEVKANAIAKEKPQAMAQPAPQDKDKGKDAAEAK
jgi:TPR repeat protein